MFSISFVLLWRPEIPAFLTGLPRTSVLITLVGMAQTQAFVLILAAPTATKGQKGRVAAYPPLATFRLH
jgi:hypothetical protein